MPFVEDTFTDTDEVALPSHTGETGASWTAHPLNALSSRILGNRLADQAGTWSCHYASGTPASAEHDVEADLVVFTTAGFTVYKGVAGRMDTSAETMYYAMYSVPDGRWELFKRVTGSQTSLGTYTQALTDGVTYRLKLEIRDAAKKLYVDDVERISSADNAITAAGRVGEITYSEDGSTATTGIHLDNFEANDAGGGDTTPPTLSSPTATATGQTTASGSVSTDEANGTLYAVVTTSATAPSAAQVAAGQDHTGVAAADAASQAVSTTGVQTISGGFTGLTAGTTYYAHYMHEDAAANQSTVATSSAMRTYTGVAGEAAGTSSDSGADTATAGASGDASGTSSDSATAIGLTVSIGGASAGTSDDSATDTLVYSVSGTVTNAGSPVEGAVIYLINQGTDEVVDTDTTDGSGDYAFASVPAGTYHVVCEVENFETPSKSFVVVG